MNKPTRTIILNHCHQTTQKLGILLFAVFLGSLPVLALSFGLALPIPARAASNQFSIIVLPDTQSEAGYKGINNIGTMTQWIADHAQQYNIKMVLGEGDINSGISQSTVRDQYDYNDTVGWQNNSLAFQTLDNAHIPYLLAAGNHDVIDYDTSPATWYHPTSSYYPYNTYFPLSRYKAMPTYGGAMTASGTDAPGSTVGGVSGVNSYQLFSAGGMNFMAITVPFGPTDQELQWASSVIAKYPTYHVLLVTHDYLGDDDQLRGNRPNLVGYDDSDPRACNWYTNNGHCALEDALPNHLGGTPMPGANNGLGIWSKLVGSHPNVQFVFSGHVTEPESDNPTTGNLPAKTPGEEPAHSYSGCLQGYQAGTHTTSASKVYQLMLNCQNQAGGGGFARMLTFQPGSDTVTVTDFSLVTGASARTDLDYTYHELLSNSVITLRHVLLNANGSTPFWDVPDNNPFAADIHWMRDTGITTGYSDNTFHPGGAVSRQAAAEFIYRSTPEFEYGLAHDHPSCSAGSITNYFTADVANTSPFCYAINYLANKGAIHKPTSRSFRPGDPTSRQAMAAYLSWLTCYRQALPASSCLDKSGPPIFSDMQTTDMFYGQIHFLAKIGIAQGYSDDTFRSTAPLSRQATAAWLHRVFSYAP
jgi:hypothetical protein